MNVAVVIPAGGSGSRMGIDAPKQLMMHRGKSLLEWSLLPFLSLGSRLDCIVVALPKNIFEDPPAWLLELSQQVILCVGGKTRQDSVHEGFYQLVLRGLQGSIWLVHDAARPLLEAQDLNRLIDKIESTQEGALLALPVRDTIKRANSHSEIVATVDRNLLWQAQTPQGGLGHQLWKASLSAKKDGRPVTDDAALMEQVGQRVHLVEGHPLNFKITHPHDWELFQRLV